MEVKEIEGAAWLPRTWLELVGLPPATTRITSAFTVTLESNVLVLGYMVTLPLEAESESGWGSTDCGMLPPELLIVT